MLLSLPSRNLARRELARAIRAAKPSDGHIGNIHKDVRRARPYTPIACIDLWDALLHTAKKHRRGRVSVQAYKR